MIELFVDGAEIAFELLAQLASWNKVLVDALDFLVVAVESLLVVGFHIFNDH